MRMNTINRLTSVTLFILAAVSCAAAQTEGEVQFNVVMPNDVLIPNLSVIIENQQLRKEIELNAEAVDAKENLVTLPAGIYHLSSRNGSYYDFKRAPFRVQAGAVSRINVFPLIRVRSQSLMADGTDRYDIAAEPKYDSFPVPNSPDPALTLMIRYDEKRQLKDSLNYSSRVRESRGDLKFVRRG